MKARELGRRPAGAGRPGIGRGGAAADASAQARRDLPNMIQQYGATLLWDASQAVRFGLEWTNIFTSYNGNGPSAPFAGRSGTLEQYRFAAWYFF